jgi:hypothetical protein
MFRAGKPIASNTVPPVSSAVDAGSMPDAA